MHFKIILILIPLLFSCEKEIKIIKAATEAPKIKKEIIEEPTPEEIKLALYNNDNFEVLTESNPNLNNILTNTELFLAELSGPRDQFTVVEAYSCIYDYFKDKFENKNGILYYGNRNAIIRLKEDGFESAALSGEGEESRYLGDVNFNKTNELVSVQFFEGQPDENDQDVLYQYLEYIPSLNTFYSPDYSLKIMENGIMEFKSIEEFSQGFTGSVYSNPELNDFFNGLSDHFFLRTGTAYLGSELYAFNEENEGLFLLSDEFSPNHYVPTNDFINKFTMRYPLFSAPESNEEVLLDEISELDLSGEVLQFLTNCLGFESENPQ